MEDWMRMLMSEVIKVEMKVFTTHTFLCLLSLLGDFSFLFFLLFLSPSSSFSSPSSVSAPRSLDSPSNRSLFLESNFSASLSSLCFSFSLPSTYLFVHVIKTVQQLPHVRLDQYGTEILPPSYHHKC